MKIQKIEAENFKLFTSDFDKIQDIADSDMILFNGPNGYGKTSVFDIIEFCLVDILRYGFGDRQIFISTHEQSFEWFLRYRYSKAGKNVKIFNMKDIMLQEE